MLLELKNIEAAYGNIKALKGINLAVPEGKIVTLIGANGAGKSTTMKTIMGVMKPIAGDVLFKGESIAGKKTYDIVNSGVVLVPEGRQILQGMTVRENIELVLITEMIRRKSQKTWPRSSSVSRASLKDRPSSPAPFPAANSRCSRSAAP